MSASKRPEQVHHAAMQLMQRNTIVTNLFLEKQYKGYTALTKKTRKQLYKNAEAIEQAFYQFLQSFHFNEQTVQHIFAQAGVAYPKEMTPQLQHMAGIMAFLRPGNVYEYIPTASFDKLLQRPGTQRLRGDCNQIVTLYAHLYTRRFPITDLQIRLLPQHVCLHIAGIDVEATTGQWQKYDDDNVLSPMSELLAVNLLDVTDFREMTTAIDPRTFVKGAQLAYQLSSHRTIVDKNLDAAYRFLANDLAQRKQFDAALVYAKKVKDPELIRVLHHNAAVHAMEQQQWKKAVYFAKQANEQELVKAAERARAQVLLKKGNITQARKIVKRIGDQAMLQATYRFEYNALVKSVPRSVRKIAQHQKHHKTYLKMLEATQKGGMKKEEKEVRAILAQL